MAESCSRSKRPIRKVLDRPSYTQLSRVVPSYKFLRKEKKLPESWEQWFVWSFGYLTIWGPHLSKGTVFCCKPFFVFLDGSSVHADLRLLNGLLPVIILTVLRPHLKFPNCWLFPGWGRQSQAQPTTWRTRSPCLYPLETGWPSYTPRHRVPILVAFYDMHGLQWDYSFPRSL
jgi:hypothetical protein